MMSIRRALLLLLLAWSLPLRAQETKYIDLSFARQRTELRHPPAPPADCKEGVGCFGGGSGGASVTDGAPDWRDPRAPAVRLLRVTPTHSRPLEPSDASLPPPYRPP